MYETVNFMENNQHRILSWAAYKKQATFKYDSANNSCIAIQWI